MSRKVILTSGLILVGQESRSYIGLAWVVAGMYGMLFAWIKPIRDVTENRLMTISLAVTVVNLGIGAVSRIPAENLPTSIDPYTDAVLFKILVFGANSLVIGLVAGKIILSTTITHASRVISCIVHKIFILCHLLLVQYAMFLYQYLKKWRKNPQWSFSCCLALLLPLNDFQEEIVDHAETNVLQNQLQTGDIEMPSIFTTVKDSGAIDVTLEEDEHGDENTVKERGRKGHDTACMDRKRHQNEPLKKKQKEIL